MASSTDSFTGCSAPAGSSRAVRSGTGHGDALQQFGELHREVDSLADLTCALGVGAGTVRVSVGIEDPDDIVADFAQALS